MFCIFLQQWVIDENGKKKYVQLKVVIINVVGAAGNLICPPVAFPGETTRWAKFLFSKLLVLRRCALIEFNVFTERKWFPELITSDTLSGIQRAYYEALAELGEGLQKLGKQITFFSRDVFHLR